MSRTARPKRNSAVRRHYSVRSAPIASPNTRGSPLRCPRRVYSPSSDGSPRLCLERTAYLPGVFWPLSGHRAPPRWVSGHSAQATTSPQNAQSELHIGLKGTMGALYLKDLADKTRRGLRGRVEEGKSGGGLCFGYDVVRQFDASGEAIRGERRINEAEATVARPSSRTISPGSRPARSPWP
jgi:hypothetical protein